MSQLARHLSSAGGMYTYVTRGLGSFVGWLMAWAFTLAEPIVPAALFAVVRVLRRVVHHASSPASRTTTSGCCSRSLCGLLVWLLDLSRDPDLDPDRRRPRADRDRDLPGRLAAPDRQRRAEQHASVFIPADGNSCRRSRAWCSASSRSSGSRPPRRSARRRASRSGRSPGPSSCRAVLIGLFYIFCYYAATVFFGPDKMQADFLGFNDGNPWGGMAEQVLPGIGGLLVTFAILNSSLANANAGANASTRVIFSLGRAGLLPRAFAAVHPTYRTPVNAVHVQGILGIVLAVGLGLLFKGEGSRGRPAHDLRLHRLRARPAVRGDVHRGQRGGHRLLPGASGATSSTPSSTSSCRSSGSSR